MLIDVDLERDGRITQMDDSLLERREGREEHWDDDGVLHDSVEWVEYWLKGNIVHRSAHTTIHRVLPEMKPILGMMG